MAENESLDLNSQHAWRWRKVLNAALKGKSPHEVGAIRDKTTREAIHAVLGDFKRYGVTIADFIANRNSPRKLADLIQKTKGHDYARSLVSILRSQPESAPPSMYLYFWMKDACRRMTDQIELRLAGTDHFPGFYNTRAFFDKVEKEPDDLEAMAVKLAGDPHWRPVARAKPGESKVDPTADRIHDSLLLEGGLMR